MLAGVAGRRQGSDVAMAMGPAAPGAGPLQSAALMAHQSSPTEKLTGSEWRVLGTLLPYLLEYKWRVLLALICLVSAKLANVAVPLVMKEVVDRLDSRLAILAVPAAL